MADQCAIAFKYLRIKIKGSSNQRTEKGPFVRVYPEFIEELRMTEQ
jgi:hypothetical protein